MDGFSYGINSDKKDVLIKGEVILRMCSKTPGRPDCAGFINGFKNGKKKLAQKQAEQPINEGGDSVSNLSLCKN